MHGWNQSHEILFIGAKRVPMFSPYMGVSENSGTPKSSILIVFSIINHPFWGYHYFWKHPYLDIWCDNKKNVSASSTCPFKITQNDSEPPKRVTREEPGHSMFHVFSRTYTTGRLTWNPKMEVWKMIFLYNWVIFRFHVNLPGCNCTNMHCGPSDGCQMMRKRCH